MAKPGEYLHRLVEHIERAIHDSPNVKIESPKRIRDKDTEQLREHDVVLTFTQGHHTFELALECRDRSRKVGVPAIEAFANKCQRTGIDRGIVVSSSGFTKTGLKKAAASNIGCLSLEEVEGFDWCLAPGIAIYERRLTHVSINVIPEREVDEFAKLYGKDGQLISGDEITNLGKCCLSSAPPSQVYDGSDKLTFRSVDHGFHMVDSNGDRVDIRDLGITVSFEVFVNVIPFDFREYVDVAKGKSLYTLATATIDTGGLKGRIIIMHEEGAGTTVSFVPANPT